MRGGGGGKKNQQKVKLRNPRCGGMSVPGIVNHGREEIGAAGRRSDRRRNTPRARREKKLPLTLGGTGQCSRGRRARKGRGEKKRETAEGSGPSCSRKARSSNLLKGPASNLRILTLDQVRHLPRKKFRKGSKWGGLDREGDSF